MQIHPLELQESVRFTWNATQTQWIAHKHGLISDEVSPVLQTNLNQSGCDRITNFAPEESGPLFVR